MTPPPQQIVFRSLMNVSAGILQKLERIGERNWCYGTPLEAPKTIAIVGRAS